MSLPDILITPSLSARGVTAHIPYECGHEDKLFFAEARFVKRDHTDRCLECRLNLKSQQEVKINNGNSETA